MKGAQLKAKKKKNVGQKEQHATLVCDVEP